MITQKTKESKIRRCLKAPIRALTRARDFYIQSMSQCAGGTIGCPTPYASTLPKSFSVNSSRSGNDDDFRELVRIASARSLGNKIEVEILRRQQGQSPATGVGVAPRSRSVAIGRIEEDKAYCEFGEDSKVLSGDVYPRSRSYAVGKRNIGMLRSC